MLRSQFIRLGLLAIIAPCLMAAEPRKSPKAAPQAMVEAIEVSGILLEYDQLFKLSAKGTVAAPAKKNVPEFGTQLLVTEAGVYAFLETPENKLALSEFKSNSPVSVKGSLLTTGNLIALDSVSILEQAPKIDLKKYREEKGKPVTLSGKNLCQCGLEVGGLPHSCQLGHLHHLQARDGKIYNYLPVGRGSELHQGKGSHFQSVEVKARLFPGNLLLVDAAKVTR
jgi:hypothetical protein